MNPLRILLLCALFPALVLGADWPQWRGPTRDGAIHKDAKGWPDKLEGDRLKQAWRVDVSAGYASPIVSGDRVFTVETLGNKEEIARAFDRATGRQLWESRWDGAMTVPFFAWKNGSWVRCTPAWDGQFLYVGGMRDVLVCLNAADGKQKWRVNFMERYQTPLPAFGFVSSPLLNGDHLYVQAGAGVIKLNKDTGESVWRVMADEGGMWGSAFSSPMLARLHGVEQLLVQTRQELAGLDPKSGTVLWRVKIPAFRGMNIINPCAIDESRVFTSSYGGGSYLFEVHKDPAGQWSVREIWKNKIEGYMGTPAIIDGHIYLHCRDQKLRCVELASGAEKWASPERYGEYMSMVVNGKSILALDQRGELLLIQASPEKLKVIDRRRVSDAQTWAHLAVCGDEIWIRELNAIARWIWK
jgi:outer membrane protein assembly factor BamB